jgi:hypothetical protein
MVFFTTHAAEIVDVVKDVIEEMQERRANANTTPPNMSEAPTDTDESNSVINTPRVLQHTDSTERNRVPSLSTFSLGMSALQDDDEEDKEDDEVVSLEDELSERSRDSERE